MYLFGSLIGLIEGSNHDDPKNRTQLRDRDPTFETLETGPAALNEDLLLKCPRPRMNGPAWDSEHFKKGLSASYNRQSKTNGSEGWAVPADQPLLDTLTGQGV